MSNLNDFIAANKNVRVLLTDVSTSDREPNLELSLAEYLEANSDYYAERLESENDIYVEDAKVELFDLVFGNGTTIYGGFGHIVRVTRI